MKPLVSILIPAYNAEKWIGDTLRSAVGQTWDRKEIIVINDGSTDGTAEVAETFASSQVKVVSTENRGLSAAVNLGYRLSQGDFIQELDSDDVLGLDKIEKQLGALRENGSRRLLLSCVWTYFYYRTRSARFVPNSLWTDLSPADWLRTKLDENLHMQNATWLVSRELAEAAGPWNEDLVYDQDGEYFARVLLASEGTRFVPEAKIFYRASSLNRISYIGNSVAKKESLLRSMKLHMQYLRSLEDSDRVRQACLKYLQRWSDQFYPDMFTEVQVLASELGGQLEVPRLRKKFAWMVPLVGAESAKWAQRVVPEMKSSCARQWDKLMFNLEGRLTRGEMEEAVGAGRAD